MASTLEPFGAAQYSVTRHGKFSVEWEIKSRGARDPRWIQLPFFGPCMLLDEQRQPLGKISSQKFFSNNMNIAINMRNCHVRAVWRPTRSSFHLEGTTDVKGYETINWKWKRKGWDTKFSLENKINGRIIAEFRRNLFKNDNISEICIYETFPEDINWFIVFSACYSLNYAQSE